MLWESGWSARSPCSQGPANEALQQPERPGDRTQSTASRGPLRS